MAQITKGSQYTFDLYFFCYCSWGSRPALSSLGNETALRNARPPNSRGCLSLNLNNQKKKQKKKHNTTTKPPQENQPEHPTSSLL